MAHFDEQPISDYNSLCDKHLTNYFGNSRIRKNLVKTGLITRRGEIVSESSFRMRNARIEHRQGLRALLAQAIVHKALGMERDRQMAVSRNLDEVAKIQSVQRIREERQHHDEVADICAPPRLHRKKQSPPRIYNKHQINEDREGEPREKARLNSAPYTQAWRSPSKSPTRRSVRQRGKSAKMYGDTTTSYPGVDPHPQSREQEGEDQESSREARSLSGDREYASNSAEHTASSEQTRPPAQNKTTHRPPRLPTASSVRQQSLCDVTMKFYGQAGGASGGVEEDDLSHDVLIEQQPCGGNTLIVYKNRIRPGDTFTFVSRRHRGYPFSLSVFIDGVKDCRVSTCCEYKHRTGVRLGGKAGYFGFVKVTGAARCYRCQAKLDLQNKRKSKMKERSNPDYDEDFDDEEPDLSSTSSSSSESNDEDGKEDEKRPTPPPTPIEPTEPIATDKIKPDSEIETVSEQYLLRLKTAELYKDYNDCEVRAIIYGEFGETKPLYLGLLNNESFPLEKWSQFDIPSKDVGQIEKIVLVLQRDEEQQLESRIWRVSKAQLKVSSRNAAYSFRTICNNELEEITLEDPEQISPDVMDQESAEAEKPIPEEPKIKKNESTISSNSENESSSSPSSSESEEEEVAPDEEEYTAPLHKGMDFSAYFTTNSVEISHVRFSNFQIVALAEKMRQMNRLQDVQVVGAHLTDSQLSHILMALTGRTELEVLKLDKNKIGPHGAHLLSEKLVEWTGLKYLGLSDNPLDDAGVTELTSHLQEKYQTAMSQPEPPTQPPPGTPVTRRTTDENKEDEGGGYPEDSHSPLSSPGRAGQRNTALSSPLPSASITNVPQARLDTLDLSNTEISESGVAAIGQFLTSGVSLRVLLLTGNREVGLDGWRQLGIGLSRNKHWQTLSADFCNLDCDALRAILRDIEGRNEPTVVDVEDNPFDREGMVVIRDILKRRGKAGGSMKVLLGNVDDSVDKELWKEIDELSK